MRAPPHRLPEPVVAFNNHVGSTRASTSWRAQRCGERLDIITGREEITPNTRPASHRRAQHDGSTCGCGKPTPIRPADRGAAVHHLHERQVAARSPPGCSSRSEADDLHAYLNTVPTPFNALAERELCPAARRSSASTRLCAERCATSALR